VIGDPQLSLHWQNYSSMSPRAAHKQRAWGLLPLTPRFGVGAHGKRSRASANRSMSTNISCPSRPMGFALALPARGRPPPTSVSGRGEGHPHAAATQASSRAWSHRECRAGCRGSSRRVAPRAGLVKWEHVPAWVFAYVAKKTHALKGSECGPGMYENPEDNACVYICREGWVWDPELKACRQAETRCEPGFRFDPEVLACVAEEEEGEKVSSSGATTSGRGLPPPLYALSRGVVTGDRAKGAAHNVVMPGADTGRAALNMGRERRWRGDGEETGAGKRGWGDRVVGGVVRFLFHALVMPEEECPPGFYLDGTSCVAVCGPGYVYDAEQKKCVPREA